MTTNTFSSEEMIRQAKETLRLAKEDFLPKVDNDLADMGMVIGGAPPMTDGERPESVRAQVMVDRLRAAQEATQDSRMRRVDSSTQDHLVVAQRNAPSYGMPVPPSPVNSGTLTANGRGMRIVGNLLLGFVAAIWVLLLIGLIDDPGDPVSTIGGGFVITVVPFLFGVLLRRSGRSRGTVV